MPSKFAPNAQDTSSTSQQPDMGNNPPPLDLPANPTDPVNQVPPVTTTPSPSDVLPPPADLPKEPSDSKISERELQLHLEKKQMELEQEWQKKMDAIQAEKQAEIERIAKEKEELESFRKKIELEQNKDLSEQEKTDLRLKELEQSNEKLREQLEHTAKTAEERVRLSEIRSYREKRIMEEGIRLTELVSGDTKEEIEASIVAIKQREDTLFKEVAEKAKKEAFEAAGQNVPAPLAPSSDVQTPTNNNELSNHVNRRDLASVRDRRQYMQERNKRLQNVAQSAGLRR